MVFLIEAIADVCYAAAVAVLVAAGIVTAAALFCFWITWAAFHRIYRNWWL